MPQPPTAPRHPHVWDRPTGAVEDPWAWLGDRDHPDTIAYLDAENAYTTAWMAPLDELVDDDLHRDQGPGAGDRCLGAGP